MAKEENNPQPQAMEPISIIVPCLNEEHYIGTLLACLARQIFQNFEVIVVDGNSEDDTFGAVERAISSLSVLSDKVRCVAAPTQGVAAQRNYGAALARHERLVFFDADVQIPNRFLEGTLKEIYRQDLDMATTVFEPISERVDDRLAYSIGNLYIQLQQYLKPVAMGFCIFTTKQIHRDLDGFDEEITLGEDYDYVHRAAELEVTFKVLTKERAYVSIRRLKKEGRLPYYYKAVMSELLSLVKDKKEVSGLIEYEMGNHEKVPEAVVIETQKPEK
jgi:glycosyltransferase involved in cell wall biosynthesis